MKPIGIEVLGQPFYEIIPAGQSLPHTFSQVFANAEDNQKAIQISLAQRDSSGTEQIAYVVLDELPPHPRAKLNVIVTVRVTASRQLFVKATVPESGYVRQYGPFPVE